MKTMCPPDYHHNGFVAIYIYIQELVDLYWWRLTVVQNATIRDFYSTHAPILLSFPCSYFSKIVSRKFLLPHKESKNVDLWSSPSAMFVSFRNVWPLILWFHRNKIGKLNMCRSFSCSNFTISFVKKQTVWKLISQKLIVKIK